jgi:hypothetical protein
MPKLAREELVVKCDTREQADYIVAWAGEGIDVPYQHESTKRIYFRYYGGLQPDFSKANPNMFPQYKRIDFAEQFPEYEQEVSEVKEPELNLTQCVHLSAENAQDLLSETHYEYAVLTNATESAKKQIAEFEQVLTQIKIDAMKLGSRDLARLIKALKEI